MTQDELGEEYVKEKKQLQKQIEIHQEQIEQIKTTSQFELIEYKNQLDIKSNQYQQLQNEFQQYKLIFNAKSDNLSELNEQVKYLKNNSDHLFQYLVTQTT
jgi:chromosome segregation ATPase